MRRRIVAVAAACTLAVSGCGVLGSASDDRTPETGGQGGQGGQGGPAKDSRPLVKEGWFGIAGSHVRLEIQRVERHADRSVLRFYVTSLANEADTPSFGTAGAAGIHNLHFDLVDPVGRKLYRPMYDDIETTVGSAATQSEPGVRYEAVLYFAPIPKGVDTVTVISPGTAGEFTGVPVVDSNGPVGPAAPTPSSGETPARGSTKAWPLVQPQGQPKGEVQDLYDITENATQSKTASGTDETIGLSTDVLFAFDSAQLSDRAKAVLDGVAAETRAKADPAKPPILIEGHTDGKGTPAYNLPLSQRRAEAVHKELQARLGSGYQYQVAGKGETEPIAEEGGADDAKARQKNRRVEVSYHLKQQTSGTTVSPGATATHEATVGAPGGPAPFRPDDGATVASRTADFNYGDSKRRIDVKPFYRDGAYLVAVFDVTNLGPGQVSWLFTYAGDSGGNFGSFSVVDPATKLIYRGVRIGPDNPDNYDDNYVDPGLANFRAAANTTNRGFFYVPAPPPSVRSVTLDAGSFGQIPNVPIK
jgi:outer membrane protein OmpA-like peptidoglycan-associated protein